MSKNSSIRAFSERLMPPFSGQVQIAESDTYRALTIDGEIWEIQYVNRSHVRVATINDSDIKAHKVNPKLLGDETDDGDLINLFDFLAEIELPFPATDIYEYWLLDVKDQSPLALVFSCSESSQMSKFPARAEWTALPAAVMPVDKTEDEEKNQSAPVNYRLERLVAERAGTQFKGRWFNRDEEHGEYFPSLMVREDWPEESQHDLCQRYIERQAPRLLMLHDLSQADRERLESYCRPNTLEVARFYRLYPKILDEAAMQAMRVEARFRAAADDGTPLSVHSRRDGVLYI